MTDKPIIIDGVDIAGCEFAVKPINDNRIKCHCAKGLLQIAKMQEQPESIKSGLCENNHNCYYKQLQREKQSSQEARDTGIKEFNRAEELNTLLKRKENELEELRQYHNKCCEDNAKKLEEWLEKYNQVSRDFHNGDFCNTEKCQQLAQLKEENDILRKRIVTIFDCLIKANRDVIVDTLWVDKITTLWDFIAQTLGLEGDRTQIEEQIEKLYSKGE